MLSYQELDLQQTVIETDLWSEELFRQFYDFLPKNATSILEIGCKTGKGGQVLKRLNHKLKIFGMDCVLERLERIPKEVYEQCIYSLSTHLFAEDRTFDVVLAGEFIEQIYPTDVDKTLTEIFRVLKVGGRLLLTTRNPLYIKKRMRGESVLDNDAHISQHFHDTLSLKLRMIGFASVKVYGSGKVTRYLGYHFPWLNLYGSYLIVADKI